jgi:hypothetical protein
MSVTIERLERAIRTVAEMMLKYNLPLGPTIRFLEAERGKLLRETDDMAYARSILEVGQHQGQHRSSETD